MNTARKGRRYEHKTRDALKAQGFTVLRSAASKGCFDLVAWDSRCIRFVQCKAGKRTSFANDIRQMHLTEVPPNGTKELWIWLPYAKKPIIEVVP